MIYVTFLILLAQGDSKVSTLATSQVALLSNESISLLKGQAFVRVERVKETLATTLESITEVAPEFRAIMKLYIERYYLFILIFYSLFYFSLFCNSIDSPVARNILLKPILQEFGNSKKRIECIIASCLDPGQPKRDIEQLLYQINYAVMSELSK